MNVILSIDYLEQAISAARHQDPAYAPGRSQSSIRAVAIEIPPLYDPLRDLMLKALEDLREKTDNFNPADIPWRGARFGTQRFCDVEPAKLTDLELLDFYNKVLVYASQPLA